MGAIFFTNMLLLSSLSCPIENLDVCVCVGRGGGGGGGGGEEEEEEGLLLTLSMLGNFAFFVTSRY